MAKRKKPQPTHWCPQCGGDEVYSAHVQLFMVNTGEHYSHSQKTHDPDTRAGCTACYWEGTFGQLKEKNHELET